MNKQADKLNESITWESLEFDPKFGIKPAALAVAHLIQAEYPRYRFLVTWSPFYNGRETGICLSVTVLSGKGGKGCSWVFGEHRNSDSIFLDRLAVYTTLNPPTVADFTEEEYKNRRMFKYNEHDRVASVISKEFTEFIESNS